MSLTTYQCYNTTVRENTPLLKSKQPTDDIYCGSHYIDDTPKKVVWTLEEAIDNVGVGTYQIFIFGELLLKVRSEPGENGLAIL